MNAEERRALAVEALPHTLRGCDDPAPHRRGKVRDVYQKGDELFLVATDRVSAFDVVLGTVPFKGTLLTEQATFWLERAADVLPTHLIERVAPQVMRCRAAEPLPVELVVRGYLAGSLMRDPPKSRGAAYGLSVSAELGHYEELPEPIVTPTTKADVGEHDAPITERDIVARGLVAGPVWERARDAALALYDAGRRFAAEQDLILVDTKYEMGLAGGELVLIDEVHTADSSRFWERGPWVKAMESGGFKGDDAPRMLDKERLRRWLMSEGYQGEGTPPALPDDVRVDLALHYWELTDRIVGQSVTVPASAPGPAVVDSLRAAGF